jgi:Tfp pilus assembly protein PilO
MIHLWDRGDPITSFVTLASVVVLTGATVAGLVLPMPTTQGIAGERSRREFRAQLDTQRAHKSLEGAQELLSSRVWSVPVAHIGPTALQRVTKLAQARQLKLTAMRPQRGGDVADLTQLPFIITVEGPFPQALGFVNDIQAPANRMAVSSLQIAAQDGVSDNVTLTVVLSAFTLRTPIPEVPKHG